MKKAIVILLVLTLVICTSSVTALAIDESSDYDNWKAVFGARDTSFDGFYYGNATGTVVANYVKGKGDYLVGIDVSGLKAEQEYELCFHKNIGGIGYYAVICFFTTDADGNACFTVKGWKTDSAGMHFIEPTATDASFNIVYHTQASDRRWVLSTYHSRTDYPLDAVDSNRGE